MKVKLFDDQEDSEEQSDSEIQVNEDYAQKYEKWRAGEERQKLKDKYGDTADIGDEIDSFNQNSDSDSSSSSDDNELQSLVNDKEWLRTLALLKAKDSRIYDPNFTFYSRDDSDVASGSKKEKTVKKDTPMYLRDYERKMMLEAEGKPIDEDNEINDNASEMSLTYNEEQKKIKDSFKEFLKDGSDDEDEPLLTEKKKSSDEITEEEGAYMQWLKGKPNANLDPVDVEELNPLRQYWNDPDLPDNEKYLRDFIFQGTSSVQPTINKPETDDVDLGDDEQDVDKQADFERKYNFRFEEPDPEFIKNYPRTLSDSLRRKNDSRAKKREQLQKRKLQEKTERREDLRQMKRLKREEINEKIRKLRQITGGANEEAGCGAFRPEDLEGDYDPEVHSKMLERVFNDDYYNVAEEVRPDIGLAEEDYELYGDEVKAEAGSDWEDDIPAGQDKDRINDDSAEGNDDDEKRPWRRKKSRAAAEIAKEKPVFDPNEKTFEDYVDEYYKLDYEDVVGGMPCRFKYRSVDPMDFGLDAKEVLQARDKELNSWVSIKRVVQYRRPEDDYSDRKKFEKRAKNEKKKHRVIPSLAKTTSGPQSSRTKPTEEASEKAGQKQKVKSNKDQSAQNGLLAGFTDDRLLAYGLQPKKFKYTKHRFIQQPEQQQQNSRQQSGRHNKKSKKPMKSRPVFA